MLGNLQDGLPENRKRRAGGTFDPRDLSSRVALLSLISRIVDRI